MTRFNGGWLSPEGEFIEADFGGHDLEASHIVEKLFPIIKERIRKEHGCMERNEKCKDLLVKKGWIDLTGNPYPCMGFTLQMYAVCYKEEKVTPQQHAYIEGIKKEGIKFSGFIEADLK